jgi:maltooligosyltrehalose trehalohydrolase
LSLPRLNFGAQFTPAFTRFRVWSHTHNIRLLLKGDSPSPLALTLASDGLYEASVENLPPGTLYGYLIEDQGPFPDPASRFQPNGVHAWSEVIDPRFNWTDQSFVAPKLRDLVLYELHIGCFTPQGTYAAAIEKLPYLERLGVSAIQLMPLASAPGKRNWGYDGVSLYAPNNNYGRPEDLRHFVNECHAHGLAVYLDVVYNHFGPDGAYHRLYHPHFYNPQVQTPWGEGLNFDGADSHYVRSFFIENALHWMEDYHIDGFRLDATHAIADRSPTHFLEEFNAAVKQRAAELGRTCLVIAEDERNLRRLLDAPGNGGYGLDGVWADDFHHQIRRATAGDHHGYYQDFQGSAQDIASTLKQGWFFTGQYSAHRHAARGTSAQGIPPECFIICIQNHDQIGNRARGERLHHQIDPDLYMAAAALLLLAPQTPLLFMGQEWAAGSPFLYFTDHEPHLGKLVTEGRRREFSSFPEFRDESSRLAIPDPQEELTFLRSKLNWDEPALREHNKIWTWHRIILGLRREVLSQARRFQIQAQDNTLKLHWQGREECLAAFFDLRKPPALPALPEGIRPFLSNPHCVIFRTARKETEN